ncbi:diguanylate cyclase, partial [bacterium]
LKSLNELTSAINVQLEAKTVLETAAGHIRIVLGTDAVLLARESDGRVEVVTYADGTHDLEGLVRQGKSQRSLPIQLTETSESGAQGFAAVCPILWEGSLAGRIVAARRDRSFEYSEIHLLANIAGEVSKALLNATRHERALDAADRDPVTGLLNHRAFHQRLQTSLETARANDTPLSLAMIDMNNFKLFNDTYGHLAGDAVLRQVAEALLIECPGETMLARYGGDEYAIAAPGYQEAQLVELAERIRDRLLHTGYIDPGGTKVPIQLAFGIACFPDDATYRHDLINIADQNLYEAKHSEGGIRGASASQRENRELRAHASFETLDALVSAVDNKDRYTRKHSEDVTEYALWIADEIGLSEEAKRMVRRAGLLHDVGKIGVPDAILRKPGRLNPEEFEIVQRHPRLGELIVSAIPGMEDIVDGVRAHHERFDGAGYPDGLVGEDIPLMGRILAVASKAGSEPSSIPPWRVTSSRPSDAGIPSSGPSGRRPSASSAASPLPAAQERRRAKTERGHRRGLRYRSDGGQQRHVVDPDSRSVRPRSEILEDDARGVDQASAGGEAL